MASKHICPCCGGTTFTTTAHAMQEWEVDAEGNFIKVTENCLQVTHNPDDDNIWVCTKCGAEAVIVRDGKEMETKEAQIKRAQAILDLERLIDSEQRQYEKEKGKLIGIMDTLHEYGLEEARDSVENTINRNRVNHLELIDQQRTTLEDLKKKNTLCLKCFGKGKVLRSRSCAEDDRPDPDDPNDYIRCDRCHGSGREPKED